VTKKELIDKLASSVGVEKASATISQCCADLKLPHDDLTHDQVLLVLDRLAEDKSIIGTVARFAKVRVILAGPPPPGLGLSTTPRKR